VRKNAEGADSQQIVTGGTVTWTIYVTNTGDVTLTGITAVDPLAPNCVQSIPNLAAGAGTSFSCNRTNVTSDFTNVITVTGTPPVGPNVSDNDPSSVDVTNPSLNVRKNAEGADTQAVLINGTVTWTIYVTNTGDVTLTGITAVDPLAPNCVQSIPNLAVGAGTSFSCNRTNVTSDFTNIITVTGTPPVGPNVSDNDPSSVDVTNPSLNVRKNAEGADSQQIVTGGTVTWTIYVTNTGDVTLTGITAVDPQAPNCVQSIPNLAVGAGTSFTCNRTNVTSDFTNVITVTGTPPVGPNVTDNDPSRVIVYDPDLTIDKTGTAGPVTIGDMVKYTITVRNTGNVTLTNVTVRDAKLGLNQNVGTLLVGQSTVVVDTYGPVTAADLPGPIFNTASVTGTTPINTPVGPVTDTHTVPVVINPGLSIDKTGDAGPVTIGSTVKYTITVRNTGNVTLTNVTVTDAKLGLNQNVGTLLVGQSIVVVDTYGPVSEADLPGPIFNTAGAVGTTPINTPVGPVTDTHSVPVVINPGLSIDKTGDAGPVTIGSTVKYTITVRNTGNVTLTNVTVTDAKLGLNQNVGTLLVGQSTAVVDTYGPVTEADLPGPIFNTAGAVGTTPINTPVGPVTDTHTVPVVVGSLTVTKAVVANGTTIPAEQSFTICIKGPSYPNGNEVGACKVFGATGGSQTWSNLLPGAYQVNETTVGPVTDFTVTGSGQVVTVPAQGTASATITNSAVCAENGITGVVFRDLNSDNVRQQGEPVFSDVAEVNSEVLVFLESTDGTVRLAQTTVNGRYFFSNIPMGLVYLIRVGDEALNPFGFYPVESSLAFDLQPLACGPLVRDFGYEPSPTGGLGDFVWYDVNINGLQDEWYDANNDGLVTRNNVTATLDSNGYPTFNLSQFEFVDLNGNDKADIEGELRKCGLEATNNLLDVFGQSEGGFVDDARTGNTGYYRTRGLDRNGVYSVTIDFADSTLLTAARAMFQTSRCKPVPGAAVLASSSAVGGAEAGATAVGELVCGSTTTPLQRVELAPSPTGVVLTADFGVVCAQAAAVGDRVWQDLDVNADPSNEASGDGLQNSAKEPGVDGIIVQLYRARDNQLISTTLTSNGGLYRFDGLIPDDYYLVFINPFDSGIWTAVNVDANATDGGDSDADGDLALPPGLPPGEAARTEVFNLAPGEYDPNWDAGLIDISTFGSSSIGDFFWHDLNKDGLQDVGEPGVPGIVVTLYRSASGSVGQPGSGTNGTVIMTTTTNELGRYLFTGLDAGYYYVKFNLPDKWLVSPRNAGTDNAFDSDVDLTTGGRTSVFYLPINTDDLTWDAGIYDDEREDPTGLEQTEEEAIIGGLRIYLPVVHN
jgi:uncharacterized repeat protein (TIGR01451 family)